MTKLIFGSGAVAVQRGFIEGEGKCITMKNTGISRPIGSTQKTWPAQVKQEEYDVVIVFNTLESARVLQDEIGELCAVWSREINPKV